MEAVNIASCRFCRDSCAPHEPTKYPEDYAVRYGPRHAAHVACAVKAKGPDWIRKLKTWQLNALPLRVVSKLQMAPVLADELDRRQAQ